jgi:BirA family transcriptional regulator, biotin operon repressor / biotin---[acetyl-CoA-carboxylase] ligase
MIDVVRVLHETFVAQAEHHPSLGSTSDRAAECAARGEKKLPLLVVADRQTAGRGRGGNRWWTGPGGLCFSLLLDPQTVAAQQSRSPLVALAAAVAVAGTLAPLLPNHPPGIRWPNDVLVSEEKVPDTVCRNGPEGASHKRCLAPCFRGRKLSGILVEVLPDRRHVLGIGLNTNSTLADAPADLQSTAATLRDLTGRQHDQTDVLVDLLRRLDQQFAQLRQDAGAVATAADALCLQRGQTVTLERDAHRTTGLCRGIAADGAIQIETPAGIERFHSGTVVD